MRYFKEECPNVIRDVSLATDGNRSRDPHPDNRQSWKNCKMWGRKTIEARGAKDTRRTWFTEPTKQTWFTKLTKQG